MKLSYLDPSLIVPVAHLHSLALISLHNPSVDEVFPFDDVAIMKAVLSAFLHLEASMASHVWSEEDFHAMFPPMGTKPLALVQQVFPSGHVEYPPSVFQPSG